MISKLSKAFLHHAFVKVFTDPSRPIEVVYADDDQRFYPDTGENTPLRLASATVPETALRIEFLSHRAQNLAAIYFPYGIVEQYIVGGVVLPNAHLVDLIDAFLESPAAQAQLDVFNPLVWLRTKRLNRTQTNRDPEQAKKNAEFHYTLPVLFFRYMLGDGMGYSEGVWDGLAPVEENYVSAKNQQCALIWDALSPGPEDFVVEVGPAWGKLMLWSGGGRAFSYTGIGRVYAQNRYLYDMIYQAGLDCQNVSVWPRGHEVIRNIGATHYVSVGVHEHAGHDGNDIWCRDIYDALVPGGNAFISTSSSMLPGDTNYITKERIFPGGHVPALPEIMAGLARAGMVVDEVIDRTQDYAKTTKIWYTRFMRHRDDMNTIDDERLTPELFRAWEFYLGGIWKLFENESADLHCHHILAHKPRK